MTSWQNETLLALFTGWYLSQWPNCMSVGKAADAHHESFRGTKQTCSSLTFFSLHYAMCAVEWGGGLIPVHIFLVEAEKLSILLS